MKYVILQGDGMGDLPFDGLDGQTPLEKANTPMLDLLAGNAREYGTFRPIPNGFPAGSDVGNMVLLGYDPRQYFTGRSPLEAAAMGVPLKPDDVCFRCNLVTFEEGGSRTLMNDYSAGHIDTETASQFIELLQKELGGGEVDFHNGVSFRHLMVWHGGTTELEATPPHDILGQPIDGYAPSGKGAVLVNELNERSREIFADCEPNRRLKSEGRKQVSSIWLWGQGYQPAFPTLSERFGLSGAVISAVDLVNGLGVLAGLERIEVPGATGYVDTNYEGKAAYALEALKHHDFLFLHVEAPDESAHEGDPELKIRAIEDFDRRTVTPLIEGLAKLGDFRVWLTPDHCTLLSTRTHSNDPVPYAIYDSRDGFNSVPVNYCERTAAKTGVVAEPEFRLIERFLDREAKSA